MAYNRRRNKKNRAMFLILGLTALILIFLFTGCAPQVIKETVNVEVPCQVEKVPKAPRDIDLNNAIVKEKMRYVQDIVQYAKEVAPIMNSCVVEGRIKGKKK